MCKCPLWAARISGVSFICARDDCIISSDQRAHVPFGMKLETTHHMSTLRTIAHALCILQRGCGCVHSGGPGGSTAIVGPSQQRMNAPRQPARCPRPPPAEA